LLKMTNVSCRHETLRSSEITQRLEVIQGVSNSSPEPKTTHGLADAILNYYQNDDYDSYVMALGDLLDAGKLKLAIELMKLKELKRISNAIEQINDEGVALNDGQYSGLISTLSYLQRD